MVYIYIYILSLSSMYKLFSATPKLQTLGDLLTRKNFKKEYEAQKSKKERTSSAF